MGDLIKKTIILIFMVSMVLLYSFYEKTASAASGSRDVEKTFDLECDAFFGVIQGIWGKATLKATVPDVVAPGEDFKVMNTSLTITRDLESLWGVNLGDLFLSADSFFNINSENETQIIMNEVGDVITPPISEEEFSYSFPAEGSLEVGPFTAGEEGHVTLKVGKIGFTPSHGTPEYPPTPGTISFNCMPAEEVIIANIPIDNKAPVITLNGDNPMIVKQGDPYVEHGATAVDNFDGDVSDHIDISGNVDTNTIGTYTVTYTVSDSVGNVATAERTVKVVEPFGDFYSGEGPPSDSLGSNGDTYLDVTTGDVYKRNPNTWTKVGNIKGDDGKQGAKILTGEGAPQADVGNVGDLYFDTKTGDVYEKTADGWVKIANLQGPAGPAGPKGPKGADGTGRTSGDSDSSGKDKQSKTGSSKVSSKDGGDKKGSKALGGKLPKTATSLPTLILVGALLALAGSVLFFRRKKAIE